VYQFRGAKWSSRRGSLQNRVSSQWQSTKQGPIDFGYRLNFHRLMALLREVEEPVRATVFGSVTDSNEMLWQHAEAVGLEVGWWSGASAAARSGSTPAL
jgi:hypothetical protein